MGASLGDIQATLKLDGFGKFSKELKVADTNLAAFGKKTTEVGKSMTKLGGGLTKGLTLPIIGVGAAVLKVAADFEVSSRKFATAFAGVSDKASENVKTLSDDFGLAESQATSLLANTGDLLKGFGATSDQALGLSTEVQKLSVALAAYNGIPVAQASEATTKALLGETEGMKSLGVVIKQADVETRLAEKGMADLTGQALLLAKAQVTLELATEQSGDAIASLAENQETLAFQSQAMLGDLKDLGVELGTILIPIAKDLVEQLRAGVEWFSELDDETKVTILQVAAVAAAIGPLITGIGLATTAVGGLTTAMAFLAANPIVLAIAGIAAVSAAVVVLGAKNKKERLEELTEQFSKLAVETGVAEDEIEQFVKGAGQIEMALGRGQWAQTFEEAAYQVEQLSINTGYTKKQIALIGMESENLNSTFKEMLSIIVDQNTVYDDLTANSIHQEQIARIKAVQEEAAVESGKERVKNEEKISAELLAQKELRANIESEYQKQWQINLQIIESNKTELEQLLEMIDAVETKGKASDEYNADRAAALIILEEQKQKLLKSMEEQRTKVLKEETKKRLETEKTAAQKTLDYQKTVMNNINALIKKMQAYQSRAQKKTFKNWETVADVTEATFDGIDGIMEITSENWQDALAESADTFLDAAKKSGNVWVLAAAIAVKAISSIISAIKNVNDAEDERKKLVAGVEAEIASIKLQAVKDELDRAYELEIAAINRIEEAKIAAYVATLTQKEREELRSAGIIEESALQRIEREKKAAIKAGDAEAVALLNRESKIEQIRADAENLRLAAEKEYKNKIAQYEYDKAVSDKKAKLSQIEANRIEALAGLKWWQWLAGWDDDINDVYASLTSTVSSLKIPDPVMLAQGGIVPQSPGGTSALIGEGASDEAVLPLTQETFQALGDAIVGSQQGSVEPTLAGSANNMILNLYIEGLGEATIPITQEALSNGAIRVPSSVIVQGV